MDISVQLGILYRAQGYFDAYKVHYVDLTFQLLADSEPQSLMTRVCCNEFSLHFYLYCNQKTQVTNMHNSNVWTSLI